MSNVTYDLEKLRKIADYVGSAQPILEKTAQVEATLRERAPQVVDTLVSQGLLSPHLKEAKVKEFIENPVEILAVLNKTAALVSTKTVGGGEGSASTKEATANEAFLSRLVG